MAPVSNGGIYDLEARTSIWGRLKDPSYLNNIIQATASDLNNIHALVVFVHCIVDLIP